MKKTMEVTEEELDLIGFYRKLSEDKKKKFLKLIDSLKKVLLEGTED